MPYESQKEARTPGSGKHGRDIDLGKKRAPKPSGSKTAPKAGPKSAKKSRPKRKPGSWMRAHTDTQLKGMGYNPSDRPTTGK